MKIFNVIVYCLLIIIIFVLGVVIVIQYQENDKLTKDVLLITFVAKNNENTVIFLSKHITILEENKRYQSQLYDELLEEYNNLIIVNQ